MNEYKIVYKYLGYEFESYMNNFEIIEEQSAIKALNKFKKDHLIRQNTKVYVLDIVKL